MRIKLLLLVFLLMAQHTAFAFSSTFMPDEKVNNNTIKGKIIDAATNEALIGVIVFVPNTNIGAVTDINGSFILHSDTKIDSIRISFIGYNTKVLQVNKNELTIPLEQSAFSLNEVIVSASREAQPRTEAPVSMSTISRKELQETKATNLYQVLNKTAGIYMVDLGNEQHSMAIRQPMGTKSLFLYLEDGIPIRATGDFNHNALIEINMAALKNIEVIRGPASSLYGSEAIGGAVNFITQSPSLFPTAKIQMEASDRGYKRTDLSFSNTYKKLGFYIGGYYADQRNGYFDHSDFRKLALNARIDYQFTDRTKLINTASLIDYKTDQTGGLDSARFFGRSYESLHTFSYRKVNALRVRSTLEHKWNENNNTSITAYIRDNAIGLNPFYAVKNIANDPLKAKGEINTDAFRSYGSILQHRKDFNFLNASLISGVSIDYSPVTYKANFINISRRADGVYESYTATDSLLTNYNTNLLNSAAYLQGEISPVKQLKLVGALRFDRLDYKFDNHLTPSAFTGAPDENNHFQNLTPKLGLTYDLGNDKGLYANYSVGFAPPAINDLYRGVKVPVLRPANFKNYELGGWMTFAGKKGCADVSLYRMDGTNEIISVRLPDGSYVNQNSGQTRHIGIEYTVKYMPVEDFVFRFSGTNASHTFVVFEDKGKKYNGNNMNAAPGFFSNTEITYKPRFVKGLRLGLEWQHVSAYFMDAANTEKYKGYELLNARVGYTYKSFECWTNIMNLTNELYATTAEKTAAGKSYRPGAPRTINVGIAYNFMSKK